MVVRPVIGLFVVGQLGSKRFMGNGALNGKNHYKDSVNAQVCVRPKAAVHTA